MENIPEPERRGPGRPRKGEEKEKVHYKLRILTPVEKEKIAQLLAGDGNISDMARALGIPPTHNTQVKRHSHDPVVQARAREILETKFERKNITGDRVLTELARLSFASAKDMFDPETGRLLEINEMDDDTAATIVGFEVEERWEGRGDSATPYTVKKIKRGDKLGALSLLAKHFKLVSDNEGINAFAGALADRLNAAKKRVLPVDEVTDVEDILAQTDGQGTIAPTGFEPTTPGDDDEVELW